MENNETKKEESLNNDTDYIQAINDLKANTVSKEDYAKLKAENKQLLDSLVNGGQLELPTQDESVNVDEIRKELLNNSLTNLDYCTKALQLRKAVIENGGEDPFLPYGHNIAPTAEDLECANRVADALQSCIDYADGDSEIFTNELQRITVDSMPRTRRR